MKIRSQLYLLCLIVSLPLSSESIDYDNILPGLKSLGERGRKLSAETKAKREGYSQVVKVSDGDTITVLTNDKKQLTIRLEGIDAPEMRQAFGSKSKSFLDALLKANQYKVKVHATGKDRYQRTIANLYVGQNKCVNLIMVRNGFAWHYKRYSKDAALALAELKARNEKIGIWSMPNPQAPWEYRSNKRSGASTKDVTGIRIQHVAIALFPLRIFHFFHLSRVQGNGYIRAVPLYVNYPPLPPKISGESNEFYSALSLDIGEFIVTTIVTLA